MIHRTSDVAALRSSTVPAAWVVGLVCGRLRLHGCETPTQAACQHRSVVWSKLCSGPPPYVCIEKRAALLCVEHTTASAHAVVPTGGPASHSPPRWAALAASGCMPTGDDIMNIFTRILEPHAHCQLERSHVGGIAAALEDPPGDPAPRRTLCGLRVDRRRPGVAPAVSSLYQRVCDAGGAGRSRALQSSPLNHCTEFHTTYYLLSPLPSFFFHHCFSLSPRLTPGGLYRCGYADCKPENGNENGCLMPLNVEF